MFQKLTIVNCLVVILYTVQ